jgi:hypothetical protein
LVGFGAAAHVKKSPGLGRTAIAVEIDLDRNSAEPMICNLNGDAMALEQIEYIFQQAPGSAM